VNESRIFISYRRDDAAGEAGRLADHLQRRFGAARIFLDIETIEPGTDFVEVLRRSLSETAAVLVVVGRRWLDITDATGLRRRLDDPADFVRQEVEQALGRGVPVVPVLVQGATLPRAGDLPPSLAPLVTRLPRWITPSSTPTPSVWRIAWRRSSTAGRGGGPLPGRELLRSLH
jgi:hypothetical protein